MRNIWHYRFRSLLLPGIILLLWAIVGKWGLIDPYLLPIPRTVFTGAVDMWHEGSLQANVLASLARVLIGFTIASISGVAVGFALGLSRGLSDYLSPTLRFLRQIPPVAFIPLFILWFGIDEGSKQAVIIYATFFPILVNTGLGVSGADPHLIELSTAYCLTPTESLRKIIIPGALPSIFAGLRLGLGNSWRALVAAEMIAASRGVGYMIMEARSMAQPEGIVIGILLIGIVGIIMDSLLIRLESLVMPWKGGDHRNV